MGRPRLVTPEEIEEASEFSPSQSFTAATLGISDHTLQKACQEYFGCTYPQYADRINGKWTKKMIKRGIHLALEGNETMLKFMLGHYAGMFEKHRHEVTVQQITLSYSLDEQPVIEKASAIDISPIAKTSDDTQSN